MMEVQKEAQRIMTMSVWKMYHSRMQRGGLRLHRSLQLSLVMRSARDLYLSAKLEDDAEDEAMAGANEGLDDGAPSSPPPTPFPAAQEEPPPQADPEPMDTQPEAEEAAAAVERRAESAPPSRARTAKASRKRRSSSLGKMGALEAGLAPSKKARLAVEEPRQEEEKEKEEEGQQQQPPREEGPFPSLARVLQGRFSARAHAHPEPAKDEPPANCCRPQGEGVLSIMVRAVVAF